MKRVAPGFRRESGSTQIRSKGRKVLEGKGKRREETWKNLAPLWGAGAAALLMEAGFRLAGYQEAARGLSLFHGVLLLLVLGAFLPRRRAGRSGDHAESFLLFGLETAFFLYALGTVPDFMDGGLLLLQKAGHDPYFPFWVWGGMALRSGAVALGFSFSRTERGSLSWAPWEDERGKVPSRGKWEPPLVKAPPLARRTPPIPLVEAVEQVTWGLAGPLGDLENVLEGLLQGEDLPEGARERLERARAEAHWCWKQVENLGKLIPAEVSFPSGGEWEEERSSAEEEARPSSQASPNGPHREKETAGFSGKGSLFLVHLSGGGSPRREDTGDPGGEERETPRERALPD